MPEKFITTDPPRPRIDDFEEYLATDDLFIDFFNHFLELPSFPEPHRFNPLTGGFEVLTPAKNQIAEKIKALSRAKRPKSSVYKNAIANPSIRLPHYEIEDDEEEEEEIKTCFNVKCLDKEQGIQWIKENRLPKFLQSDLFVEYRLAKLLSQIETNKYGMKLTINPAYRPWHKAKPVYRPASPVDETAELMKRLQVSVGEMSKSQTKEWYTVAKQLEDSLTSSRSSTRPTSSISGGASTYRSTFGRPSSAQSTPVTNFTSGIIKHKEEEAFKSSTAASVTFSSSITDHYKDENDFQRVTSQQVRSLAQVGHVVRIEPEMSDDESDQGVGSECDEVREDGIKKQRTSSLSIQANDDIETYTSRLVSNVIDKALKTIVALSSLEPSSKTATILEDVSTYDDVRTSTRDTRELSSDDQTDKTSFVSDLLSMLSPRYKSTSAPQQADDADAKASTIARKSISFRNIEEVRRANIFVVKRLIQGHNNAAWVGVETGSSAQSRHKNCTPNAFNWNDFLGEDEVDSVFSDETDESDSTTSTRRMDFYNVKGFNKFRLFLRNTLGDNLASLWMDIDRTRYSISKEKMPNFLQRMRESYLKVGSTKRLPNEILKKHKLIRATQWTVGHLQEVQKRIAEPLLLYWAPRFLVRQTNSKPSVNDEAFQSRSRDLRPTSSQSYPSPKTITILPLRPRSCLPRIKQGKRPSTKHGHVVSEYHQIVDPDVYLKAHEPPVLSGTPSPIPSYLKPRVSALSEETLLFQNLLPKRPATAGPLTRQTKARFERIKSAAARSRDQIVTRSIRIRTSPPSSESSDSTVRGSPAMESMLQALYHDTRAGWFFTQFCENSKNMLWSNAIHFWFDVQDYHYLFYKDIIDQFTIEKKSQMIYSTYVVGGSPEDVGLSTTVRKQIRSVINPPFDELFDTAEEYVLKLLIVPWNRMLGMDKESYNRVELIEQERRLNVGAKYMGCLQRKGILKEKKSLTTLGQEAEKKHEESLWDKVPEEFRHFTFDELIRNRIELEYFRKFLEQNYVKTDLMCWLDIETFKRLPHHAGEKRDEKAKEIREKYLNKKYFFGTNSPATKDEQNQAVKAGGGWGKTLKERPPSELIVEAQKYVKARIENRWLPLFLASKDYQERQRPRSQMSDVAEDVVLQKKKKRGEPWKLLDNRWQSSFRELMEFRRALSNPVTAGQFRRYVSLKGEFLENDVLFWLEVQKYKDFCHIHNDASSIESKILSIISCFINSHIPPSLQIDISNEMAEKLMEKRKELGPYVFREAQLTVFRVLFPHWSSFCEFRKTLSDEKITTTLERQRKKKLERMKQQMKEQEKEEARREELKTAKETETFDLPDMASLKGSDIAESLFSSNKVQVSWSYGKYVENLDRQRMQLLMENEVKGRIPVEALPQPDYDVATEASEASSDSDDAKSNASNASHKKKKRKEKIIYSTVRTPPASDVTSVQNDVTSKHAKPYKDSNGKAASSKKTKANGVAVPTVTVD